MKDEKICVYIFAVYTYTVDYIFVYIAFLGYVRMV